MEESKLVLKIYNEYKDYDSELDIEYVSGLVWGLSHYLETAEIEPVGEYDYSLEIYEYMPDLVLHMMVIDIMQSRYGVGSKSFDFDLFESRVSMMHHLGILDYTYKDVRGLDTLDLVARASNYYKKAVVAESYKESSLIDEDLLHGSIEILNGYILALECIEERELLERKYRIDLHDEVFLSSGGVVSFEGLEDHLYRVRLGVAEPLNSNYYKLVDNMSGWLYYVRIFSLILIMTRSEYMYGYTNSFLLYMGIVYIWRRVNSFLSEYVHSLHMRTYWNGANNKTMLQIFYIYLSVMTLVYVYVFKKLYLG